MLIQALNKITQKQDLSEQEAFELMDYLSTGEAEPAQIADFLIAMNTKGETVEELTGFAKCMREKAVKIERPEGVTIVDSCGTGGDGANTFNISTASAIVAAASGVKIAKHSNAGFSSKCGSSNVLEALKIPLLQTPEAVEKTLANHSIAFIHAPYFHKSSYHVNQVRKELGIRTVFNFLGPLTNPAKPTGQVIGVSNPEMLPKIIETLKNLGCKRALAVCGLDPNGTQYAPCKALLDEFSICGETLVYELKDDEIRNYRVNPEDFGLKKASLQDIEGGLPDENAKIIKDIFASKITGAKKDILVLNSAAVLLVDNRVKTLEEGVRMTEKLINSGQALDKLKDLIAR